MTGHGSKFGRRKEAAIDALLTQRNTEEAARVAGIGKQTLLRWMKIPEFRAAWLEARRAAVSQSNARLQQGTGAAVATILRLITEAGTPPATRLRAAESLLDRSNRAIAIEDTEVRLAALERAANLVQPHGKY